MSKIKGINVGKTRVTSTYDDILNDKFQSKSDSVDIIVEAMDLESGSISIPLDSITYSGKEIEQTPTIVIVIDGEEVELEKDKDYIVSYSNNINVGIATVTATGIGNFKGVLKANWNITPAKLSISSNDQSYEYDGKYHGTAVIVNTDVESKQIIYGIAAGVYTLDDAPQIKNYVDSHQVYFKVISNNYEPYEGSYNLEVTQLEAELSWGDSNWIYDGDSHQTICKVSNLVEGDECDVILKNNVISNIDSIDVEVIELTNSNYKLPNNTKHTITISPGFFIKQSGNWFPVKKVYKRVSGTWVLQDMQSETRKSVFDVNKTYVNSENL